MRAWIIETSTERGMLAFWDSGQVRFMKELPFGLNQSKALMPMLQQACNELELQPSQIDCIAVGIGPGSYTGIRIGVAVGKALSYAWQLPLIGFCSLQAFVPEQTCCFAAVLDAKIAGAYYLKGSWDSNQIIYLNDPQVCALDQIGVQLQDVKVLVTPHSRLLKAKLEQFYPAMTWDWKEVAPSIQHVGPLVKAKYDKQEWSLDGSLELLYLRKTEAERERESKFK